MLREPRKDPFQNTSALRGFREQIRVVDQVLVDLNRHEIRPREIFPVFGRNYRADDDRKLPQELPKEILGVLVRDRIV
jgi:hypothetical protein